MWLNLCTVWFGIFGSLLSNKEREQRDKAIRDAHHIEQLYQEYGHLLRRRCQRLLRQHGQVDDAMQEIFLTICKCHHQYEGEPRKILAWLYRITTTHCLQLLDKNKRWLRNIEEEVMRNQEQQNPLEQPNEEQHAVIQFLETLSTEQKHAVLLRHVSGLTQEEIAEVMVVTRDQVRRWLKHFQHRGSIVLREPVLANQESRHV